MVKRVFTSIPTLAVLIGVLVACSGSDSEVAETRAETESNSQQLDSTSTENSNSPEENPEQVPVELEQETEETKTIESTENPPTETQESENTKTTSEETSEELEEDISNTEVNEDPTQEIEACKLTGPDAPLSLAYDRPIHRLNTVGSIKTVVLFADFANVSANESTEDIFSIISPGAENFFRDQSYGRLSLSLFPHHEWLRLSGSTAIYRDALTSYTGHRDWIQEAMNLADDSVDFSDTDAVLVVSPPNAGDVPYGPTLMGWSTSTDGSLNADGKYIANAVTSGADLTYWGDLWYPHEMGHSLGLPDLYGATIPGRSGFTRPFSLMDDIGSTAPGYMGYSRWILKWLDDSQIACINGNTTVALTPIETHGGLKIALVPFDQSRALAIESRRKIGYDIALEREGAVVYIVNTENGVGGGSGEGPMEVLNNAQALLPNESLTYENVTITVQEANLTGDTIQIEIND